MKKLFTIVLATALVTIGAQAALVIDTSFSNPVGTDLPTGNNGALSSALELDNGWFAAAAFTGNSSLDDVANTVTLNPAVWDSGAAIGQINADANATTGVKSFEFVVSDVTLAGGTETPSFTIEVFGSDLVVANQDWKRIDLTDADFHAHWTPLATLNTTSITGAGTYGTGSVDLGVGYSMLAFRITPVDAGTMAFGDSVTLSDVNVVTAVASIPNTPAGLTATATSPTGINLEWTDTANNESGFIIERGADTNSLSAIATNAADETVFSDSGLSPNTEYAYRVTAYNATGDSTNNPVAIETTLLPVVPDTPTGLLAVAVGTTAINIAWVDASNNEDGFVIERKLGAGSYAPIATNATGVTSYSDSALSSGTEYTYQVKAFNGIGDSGYSVAASATTFPFGSTTILYEPFVYTGTSGDNLSSNVLAYTDSDGDGVGTLLRPGLSFTGLDTSGLSAATVLKEFDYRSDININFESEGTIYLSGLFNVDIATASWGGGSLAAFSLNNSGDVNQGGFWIGLCNSDGSGNSNIIRPFAGFGVTTDFPGTDTNFVVGASDLTAATTYFVLAKLEVTDAGSNMATVSLLVVEDGTSIPSTEPTVWDATVSTPYAWPLTAGIFDRFGVRQSNAPGTPGVSNLADEFRVATSYAGVVPADGEPYNVWASIYGLSGVKTDDNDGDNMSDFYEYALNGDPTNAADTGMVLYGDDGAGFFAYVYGKRTDDVSLVYTLVDTPDLVIPTYSTNAWDSQSSGPSGEANFDAVTNKYDMTGEPEQFIKLIIE